MKLYFGFYRFFLERGGFLLFLAAAAFAWAKGLHAISAVVLAGLIASWAAAWRATSLSAPYCSIEGQRLTHISLRGGSVSLRYGNALFTLKGYGGALAAFECVSRKAPELIDAVYKFVEPKVLDADLRGACIYAYMVGSTKDVDLYICEGGVDLGISLRGGCPVVMAVPRILEDLGATVIKRTYSGAVFASAFFKRVEDAVKFLNNLAEFCRPGKACEGLNAKECLALYKLLFS